MFSLIRLWLQMVFHRGAFRPGLGNPPPRRFCQPPTKNGPTGGPASPLD